jgi:hypothetical protein
MNDSERFDKIEKKLNNLETISKIHLAIVLLGFIGILSLTDILSSMNETRFYILRLSYWITLTYVGYALAYFNFILRTWLSFFITFMILCYKDFCGNHYQNIKEHNKYTTLN